MDPQLCQPSHRDFEKQAIYSEQYTKPESVKHVYSSHYVLLCASDFSIFHPDLQQKHLHYEVVS
jgi:hypothetical protein